MTELSWGALTDDDLRALVELAARVHAADGGHPVVTYESFLRRRYLSGASLGGFGTTLVDAALVAAAGIRVDTGAATGLVHPSRRGRASARICSTGRWPSSARSYGSRRRRSPRPPTHCSAAGAWRRRSPRT